MFIVAIITGLLALAAVAVSLKKLTEPRRREIQVEDSTAWRGIRTEMETYEYELTEHKLPARIAAGVLALITAIFLFFSMFYTQDVGEAKVLKSWSGTIVGEDITNGPALKAPWVDAVDFDIRNQVAAYVGSGEQDHNGQKPQGPQITATDKEGASANMDLVVVYSIKPDAVTEIYSEYKSQENFKARVIEQDVRSISRQIPAQFGTLELLSNREQASNLIKDALTERWAAKGVTVDSVSLQEIRYSDEVKGRFDAAQSARIEIEKAKAELQATEVSAQQKIVQAEAEASANRKLAESLTGPILEQRRIDMMGKLAEAGNLMIVPESGNVIANVAAK